MKVIVGLNKIPIKASVRKEFFGEENRSESIAVSKILRSNIP
jgi:hypothetical protein